MLADAWLPDLFRLGELEAHLGDGVIEEMVDAELAAGGFRSASGAGSCRTRLSPPDDRDDADAGRVDCEALSALAGLLADVPLAREWHVPTGKVVTDWRLPVPAAADGGPVLAGRRAAGQR